MSTGVTGLLNRSYLALDVNGAEGIGTGTVENIAGFAAEERNIVCTIL